LGATASLVESVQDPQKREQNLELLKTDSNLLLEQLAQKGETTEQVARSFVDLLITPTDRTESTPTYGTPSSTVTTSTTSVAQQDVQIELQELTAQIAAMRTELEKLRNPDSEI